MAVTSEEPSTPGGTAWQGSSPAVELLRGVLSPCAPGGELRLVAQWLALHEEGLPAGEHEVLSCVADVDGNLVAVPLRATVRADPGRARSVDAALAQIREDLAAQGLVDVDSLEVVLDADGTHRVLFVPDVEVSPAEAQACPPHDAVHDGDHHIAHRAPELEDLRDRLAEGARGPLARAWEALLGLLRGR